MNKENLVNTLLAFDEEVYLRFGTNNIIKKYECYIVGGGAMILLNLIPRVTYDIDVIRCTGNEIIDIMKHYDININASAHIDCFPDGYTSRAIKIDLKTKMIDFYVLSLEDIVVSKLASGRAKDFEDIHQNSVLDNLNWNKLDKLIELTIEGMISNYNARELSDFYKEYKRECKR